MPAQRDAVRQCPQSPVASRSPMEESQFSERNQVVRATSDGVTISVHVQPKASRTECAGMHGHAVKIRVAAPPSDGAANDELCRFLARICDLPVSAVHILSGAGSRQKRILLKGRSAEQIRRQLHLE